MLLARAAPPALRGAVASPRLSQPRRCAAPLRTPRRACACRAAAVAAVTPPAARGANLVASIAARAPAASPAAATVPFASQTLALALPGWLAVALSVFLTAFASLFAACLFALLPVLAEVKNSARSVATACSSVVVACREVESLAVLMQHDIRRAPLNSRPATVTSAVADALTRANRQVEAGISKPLATLSQVATRLPTAAIQAALDDPDTKLLSSVATSMRDSTARSIRERMRKWATSLETIRNRLQAESAAESGAWGTTPRRATQLPPSQQQQPAAARGSAAGAERAAVEAWAGAASAVAAAESAAARLEDALDSCEAAGACADESSIAEAAERVTRDAAEPPSNPS